MGEGQSVWILLSYGNAGYLDEFVRGLGLTLQISFGSYSIGFLLGLGGAGAKLSNRRWLASIGDAYTTVVRAVPELLLLFLLYYTGTSTLSSILGKTGIFAGEIVISPFAAAISSLGFIQGAYLTEILRGAILSVPKGQMEAARAFGMDFWQRFERILFPQMMRYALPGLGNVWLNATKDSALIVTLGSFPELLSAGRSAALSTKMPFLFYSICALFFLALSIASMLAFHYMERHFSRDSRAMR